MKKNFKWSQKLYAKNKERLISFCTPGKGCCFKTRQPWLFRKWN